MFEDMFTLKGRWNRLNRQRYFGYSLLLALLLIVLTAMGGFVMGSMAGNDAAALAQYAAILNIVVIAVSLWPSVCLGVKRLHDLDKPGWLWLLLLVPFVGFLLAIYMLFFKGTEGENQFGPDPLGQQA